MENYPQPISGSLDLNLLNDFIAWTDRSKATTRSYIINLRQFVAYMRYQGIASPTRQDIISFRDWLASEHEAIIFDPVTGWRYRTDSTGEPVRIKCKPATIAQYLRSVCQFFRWTDSNGLYPDIAANIHAPKISGDTHKKEAFSATDVIRIESAISLHTQQRAAEAAEARKDTAGKCQRNDEQGRRLRAMYLLAVTAGLRTVEISRANIKDLETKGGQSWLYIWGKGHTEPDQKKPLAPEVAAAIKEYISSRSDRPTGGSPLFVATGNRSGGKRLAPTTISTMLKRAMQAAGYDSERLTAHSLRHTAGTAVQEITGDIYATQKYMRHSNPATTEIYLHTDTEKADAKIAQQLYDYYHGKAAEDPRANLHRIIDSMTPAQIEQLTGIAAAMI